jgi:hypothetical protein
MKYDFTGLRVKDIERWLRKNLHFSLSKSKLFANEIVKLKKNKIDSTDLTKIVKRLKIQEVSLSWTEPEMKNDFQFPNDLDESALDYTIWLNNSKHQFTKSPSEYSKQEWEKYLTEQWGYSNARAKCIARDMYDFLREHITQNKRRPLTPLEQ